MGKASLIQRAVRRAHILLQGPLRCMPAVIPLVEGKAGIEIGGPSEVFRSGRSPLPIYEKVGSLDNCDFSSTTSWAQHQKEFVFCADKQPGRNLFAEGSNLQHVPDWTYDFVLSSHNLEHFANPSEGIERVAADYAPGWGPGSCAALLHSDFRSPAHPNSDTAHAGGFRTQCW